MGPFDNVKDPRRPRPPKQAGDYVPLVRVRHASTRHNIWNDSEDFEIPASQIGLVRHRKSGDSFYEFPEDEGGFGETEAIGTSEESRLSMEDSKLSMESLVAGRQVHIRRLSY